MTGPPQGSWTPTEVRRFESACVEVAFTPDGKRVVGISAELERSEWEVATGTRVKHQPAQDKHNLIAVSADLRFGLATHRPKPESLGRLHLWDFTSGKSSRSWAEPDGEWERYQPRADLTPDATLAVTLYQEPSVRRIPGGGLSIGGETKKQVFLWDGRTGRATDPVPVGVEGVVTFSPDGTWLVSDDPEKNVVIWDVATRKPLRKLTGATGSPVTLCVSGDNKYIVASCMGEMSYTIVVWDANSGRVLHKLTSHRTFVRGMAFTPDGRALLCAERGDDQKGIPPAFHLWEAATGRTLGSFDVPKMSDIFTVAFSPDGTSFVTSGYGSKRGVVQVWNLPK